MRWSAALPVFDGMEKRFEDWCRTATAQIRFRPDHEEIQRELEAHYEDHKRDLEQLGYDPALAAERSLKAMGDPVEVGLALDRAHKPWLGWLWELSRGMVLAAVLLLLGNAAINGYGGALPWDWSMFDQGETLQNGEDVLPCPAPIRKGAYTMAVEGVRYRTAEDGSGYLEVDLTCRTKALWLECPAMGDTLEAMDSCGTLYRHWHAPWIDGFEDPDSRLLFRGRIYVEGIKGMPEWIDIKHKTGGWSFRISLPAGGDI